MLNLRDPNLLRIGRPDEPGMDSTAGVCPNISTLVYTNYSGYSNDGSVPTDIFNEDYELDEENNGYRGPGRPMSALIPHWHVAFSCFMPIACNLGGSERYVGLATVYLVYQCTQAICRN